MGSEQMSNNIEAMATRRKTVEMEMGSDEQYVAQ